MKRDNSMEIDIVIDQLTDCLIRREDNVIVETEYKMLDKPITKKANLGCCRC